MATYSYPSPSTFGLTNALYVMPSSSIRETYSYHLEKIPSNLSNVLHVIWYFISSLCDTLCPLCLLLKSKLLYLLLSLLSPKIICTQCQESELKWFSGGNTVTIWSCMPCLAVKLDISTSRFHKNVHKTSEHNSSSWQSKSSSQRWEKMLQHVAFTQMIFIFET